MRLETEELLKTQSNPNFEAWYLESQVVEELGVKTPITFVRVARYTGSTSKSSYIGGARRVTPLWQLEGVYPQNGGCPPFDTSYIIQQVKRHLNRAILGLSSEVEVLVGRNNRLEFIWETNLCHMAMLFHKGDDSFSGFVITAFLAFYLSWYVLSSWPEHGLD